jgi:hypothetical protein
MPTLMIRLPDDKHERLKAWLIAEGKAIDGRSSLMIDIDEPESESMRALTDDELRTATEVNARETAGAAIAMARRDRLSVLPFTEMVTKSMG